MLLQDGYSEIVEPADTALVFGKTVRVEAISSLHAKRVNAARGPETYWTQLKVRTSRLSRGLALV